MKKRFSLILLIGVSIVPPVFASTDLASYRPVVAHTGEATVSETSAAARQCDIAEKELKAAVSSVGNSTAPKAGSAGKF